MAVRSCMLLILFAVTGNLQPGLAQSYCVPTVVSTTSTVSLGLANVTIGNVANNTGAPNFELTYWNYSNLRIYAQAGSFMSVSITVGSGGQTQKVAMYVDWNNNGVFANNEQVLLIGNLPSGSGFGTSVYIPPAQAQGTYRLRVICDGTNSGIDPCVLTLPGEMEDYSLVVTGPNTDVLASQGVAYNYFSQGNNTISVTAANASTTTLTTMDIGYSINDGTPVVENITGLAMAAGASTTRNFAVPFNVTGSGVYKLKVWARNPNGTGIGTNGNDTFTKILKACSPLNGNYTINPNGSGSNNFLTFAEAAADLAFCGVNGPVTISVAAGTYNEQVTFTAIPGASATNTITIDGGAGNVSTRTLTYRTNALFPHVLRLNGASHVRIKNLSIISTGTFSGWGVNILSNTQNVHIKNNLIQTADYTNTATGPVTFFPICINGNITSYSTAAVSVFNLEIDSNVVNGGYYTLATFGTTTNVYDIKTRYNDVRNGWYSGIYTQSTQNVHLIGNKVAIRASVGTTGYAIYLNNIPGNGAFANEVIGNEVTRANDRSIYLVSVNNPTTRGKFYNNIGGAGLKNALSHGFYFSSCTNWNIWHNTVDMSVLTTGAGSASLYLTTATGAEVRNNILSVSGLGSNAVCLYTNDPTQQTSMEYNNYFKKGTDNQATIINFGTNNLSVSNLKGTSARNNVFLNVEPLFMSGANFRLQSIAPSPFGDPSATMATDIDGNSRCSFFPTIGASESKYMGSGNAGILVDDTLFVNSPVTILNTAAPGEPKKHTWDINNGAGIFSTLHVDYTFTTPGTYDIDLQTVSCFSTENATTTVTVVNPTVPPVANFFSEANNADQGYAVKLVDQSTGGPSSWNWSITPATGVQFLQGNLVKNPQVVLNQTGTYEVCLTATNAAGTGNTLCKPAYIVVGEAINMCSGITVTKTASGKIFDSGGRDNAYTVNQNCTLLIDPCASSVTMSFQAFYLDQGDVLRIYDGMDETGTPLHTGSGFTGTALPGTIVASTGKMFIRFMSNSAGTMTGFAATWTSVGKTFNKPVAAFRTPDTLYTGTEFTFISSATGIDPIISWDFNNDGQVDANGLNPAYKFATAGTYIVRMTAEDCGGLDGAAKSILVIDPTTAPVANFLSDFSTIAPGQKVRFFDRSTQTPATWAWTITPGTYTYTAGTNANSQNPQIVFNSVGNYTIMLTSANGFGQHSVTKTAFIKVVEYCFPGADLNSDIGISRVTFAGIDNVSLIGPDTYNNYTQTVTSASVQKGAVYPITLERFTNNEDITRNVWIDFNGDGIFHATELVASHSADKSLVWTGNITIPSNISEGSTRMRIGTGYGTTNNSPCGVNPFGEFEDYTVTIFDNLVKPVITIIGQQVVNVELGNAYNDLGATATDDVDGNLDNEIITTDNLVIGVVGTYYYRYSVSDNNGNSAEAERTVYVTPDITPPVITLLGSNPETFYVGAIYNDPGYTVFDVLDGNIDPAAVQVTGSVNGLAVGQYTLTYKVSDAAGNIATKVRTVNVVDVIAPQIILKGGDTLELILGNKYVDPGAVVFDNLNVGLPYHVDTSVIDNTVIGPYVLTYTAEDAVGNQAIPVFRTVIVKDKTAPVIVLLGDTITMKVHTSYKEPGYKAYDNYDPIIHVNVGGTVDTAQPGTNVLVYTANDVSGNQAQFHIRIVKVIDDEAPVLVINGDQFMTICRWADFTDPGVVVQDNLDAGLEAEVLSTLDVNWLGLYTIKYTVIDNSGNKSTKERMIRVIDCMTGFGTSPEENSVNVYPNPSQGMVTIESEGINLANAQIFVQDILGKTLTVTFTQNGPGAFQADMSAQPAGTYFISILSEGQLITKKIQIIK